MTNIEKAIEYVRELNKDGVKYYLGGIVTRNMILGKDMPIEGIVIIQTEADESMDDSQLFSFESVENIESYQNSGYLTIDSMVFDGENILDPYDGQKDLAELTIRYVADSVMTPHKTLYTIKTALELKEDPSEENLYRGRDAKILPETMDLIVNNIYRFRDCSRRILNQEIRKIMNLGGERFAWFLGFCNAYGLLEEIFRPIQKMNYFQHNFEDHPEGVDRDGVNKVLTHIIDAMSLYEGNDLVTMYAILFHDIGKILSYSFSMNDEGDTFHSYDKHWENGSNFFRIYAKKELDLTTKQINDVCFCIENLHLLNETATEDYNPAAIANHRAWNNLREVYLCNERSKLCYGSIERQEFLKDEGKYRSDAYAKEVVAYYDSLGKKFIRDNLRLSPIENEIGDQEEGD